MALLIALVNIIGWSLIPLTVKDSPQSQIAGMGIVTALIIYLFTTAFDAATWAVAFIAGCYGLLDKCDSSFHILELVLVVLFHFQPDSN